MDEIRKQYIDDLKEKNTIKQSAYRYAAKPVFNGYTEKQASKKSGDVEIYSPEKSLKMSWREFKLLPDHIKREHLLNWFDHGARDNIIAEHFNVSSGSIFALRKGLGVKSIRGSVANRDKWDAYLKSFEAKQTVEEPITTVEEAVAYTQDHPDGVFVPVKEPCRPRVNLTVGSLTISGTWEMVSNYLAPLMGDEAMTFDICFRKEANENERNEFYREPGHKEL